MASTDSQSRKVLIGTHVPEERRDELKALAARNGRSVSSEIRLAINNWVALHSGQQKDAA
jgi:plasmid stability protein